MRAALVCSVVASLLLATGVTLAQSNSDEAPSLLPLPTFSPPALPGHTVPPASLDAPPPRWQPQASSPSEFRSVAAGYAEKDVPTPSYINVGPDWEQPTEPMLVASRNVINPTAACTTGDCCYGSSCGTCSGCLYPGALNGSPYAQAFNTAAMPPTNIMGAQFQPGYWFGSLDGLIMTRDMPNALSTTYNSSKPNTNLLDTGQAKANWAGGGQVMFGRWFGPQAYGMQFVYWGLWPMTGSASVVDPNYQLSTPFNLGNVNIGQQSPTFYFDNAHQHALWRKDGFNNFEWNALRRVVLGPCAPRLMFTGIAGLRYFRFQDGLIFGGVNSNNFSDAGGAFAAYLNTNVNNSLVGVQLGTRIDYFVLPRVRLYAQPMVGFFGNDVSMREHLYSGDGAQGFDVIARRSTFSTLGQLDVGAGYQINPRWSAFAAYRLMGVTRVGLADNQIPAFWADQQGMQHIKTNGDLILHGIMLGSMWNF